jgi:glyoxylase-like metal-dependent hydrolase (beta-lactamase superfamily II)
VVRKDQDGIPTGPDNGEDYMGEITTITLALPFRMGTVNCYLMDTGAGSVLIDTGPPTGRGELERKLAEAGCAPGDLGLIVLTHGDFDHIGNAAYVSAKHGASIAMHPDDRGMAEQGDMFWNRSSGNPLMRMVSPLLFRFSRSHRFRPDIPLEEGADLSEYGFAAKVLSIPGHSRGSVGLITSNGDLFCGDLLENVSEPAISSIMDDATACGASVARLRALGIGTVYPGHGKPFPMEQLVGEKE